MVTIFRTHKVVNYNPTPTMRTPESASSMLFSPFAIPISFMCIIFMIFHGIPKQRKQTSIMTGMLDSKSYFMFAM